MPQGGLKRKRSGHLERHGGLDAVVERINQSEDETVASDGAGWIDTFRLWGSSSLASNDRNLKVVCKLRRQPLQIRLSQRAEPSPLWWCRFRKTVTGHGISHVLTT